MILGGLVKRRTLPLSSALVKQRRRLSPLATLAAAAMLSAVVAGACSSAAPEPPARTKAPGPEADVCEGSKPPWRDYTGPLRGVRCEQEQFLRMSVIMDDLGVKCGFCHQAKDDTGKNFDYPAMTANKETGLWMHRTFVDGLRRADGKPTECGDCHVGKDGKPAAKFLGTPRDVAWSVEWMTTTMTNRFVHKDGSKLKCKHCHDAGWGEPGFVRKVIGRDLPFAPPAASAAAAPADTAAPTVPPSPSIPPAASSAPGAASANP